MTRAKIFLGATVFSALCAAPLPADADDGAAYSCNAPIRDMSDTQFRYCIDQLRKPSSASRPEETHVSAPVLPPLSATEKSCSSFGFSRNTPPFGDCVLRLELAKQEAAQRQQEYELLKQEYERQIAAQAAQERAMKEERDRMRWMALARFGAGMANSNSTTFAGAMADGGAAMNGEPIRSQPTPPVAPNFDRITVYTPNGRAVVCRFTGIAMVCQ